MAPSLTANGALPVIHQKADLNVAKQGNKFGYVPGLTKVETFEDGYEYDHLRPQFPDVKWAPLEEVPYDDKGKLGDPHFKNLLDAATDVFDYTPKIGTEIHGIKLKDLNEAQKNDLARLLAHRGVVFFRDQADFTLEDQLELGRYFGNLHKHATTMLPKNGEEEVHVIFTDEKSKSQSALFTPAYLWHSDVTYELQPPSYTSLKVLTGPPRGGGGDTLWSSQYAAYDALSPAMQKYLEGLTALHSADEQADGSIKAGRPVRRDPITTEHPLIRTNPVTGWKSVFFNPGFVRAIVGVPKLESEYIYRYLTEIISATPEFHARFRWEKDSVAIWDNRITNHSPTFGFYPHRRHAVRVTVQGERPYLDPAGRSQTEEVNTGLGWPLPNKDGSGAGNYND